jgi:DNA polymerase-3 subunit epsilon
MQAPIFITALECASPLPHPALVPLIRDIRFTAIDFESAGAAPGRTDSPVQVGLAEWSPQSGYNQTFSSYLATTQPVTWAAQKVHGITLDDLVGAPSLLSLWPTLKEMLGGAVVVAHGKGTEKRFLRAFPGHGFGPWIDTLHLARAAWPELPDHSLGAICQSRGVCEMVSQRVPRGRWHDALYDAMASLILLEHLIETFELLEHPLESILSPDTSSWHRLRR